MPPNLASRSGTRGDAKLLPDLETPFVDQNVSVRVENEVYMGGVTIKLSADCVEAVPLLDNVRTGCGGLGRFDWSRRRRRGFWTGNSGRGLHGIRRIQRQTEPNAHIGQFAFETIIFLPQAKGFKMLDVRFPG